MNSELHLGQAQRAFVGLGRDSVVARERELEPAAEREAVDGCDRWDTLDPAMRASSADRARRSRCPARRRAATATL